MNDFKFSLRAHHGLCLSFFRGKGYSKEFVENMTDIKTALSSDPLVKIVTETEDICCCCPNNINGKCTSFQKVLRYDNDVLSACGLHSGTVLPYSAFEKLVREKILQPGLREKICGDCQWSSLCH